MLQRQYRDTEYSFLPGSELHNAMLFFEALLPNLPPLVVPVVPDSTPPLLVYTDAAFHTVLRRKRAGRGDCAIDARRFKLSGGLGVVVYDPVDGSVRRAAAEPDFRILLSSWQTDKRTYIAELEALAALAAYSTYPDLFAGRRVNHFIDNTVALSALVHGYAGKPDLAKLVNVFYLQLNALRSSVYLEYVPSKANIADLPSRFAWAELDLELAGLAVVGDEPDALVVPDVARWRQTPLRDWASRDQWAHFNRPV